MVSGLAYLALQSPRAQEWRAFGTTVLGAEVTADSSDEVVRLRVDDAAWRIQVSNGPVDRVECLGWAVADAESLDQVVDRVGRAGLHIETASAEEARQRKVNHFVWFIDPWGFRHEVSYGQLEQPGTFHPGRPISGFVTGEQGFGHVVLVVPDQAAAHDFYTSALGFRLTDKVVIGDSTANFYHCNSRHHTLALAQSKTFTGIHHLMLQVRDIDDMGSGFDVARDAGVPIRKGIGQHANDEMVSFYMQTPSSLQIEYGVSGRTVSDPWAVKTYGVNSVWGHRVPASAPTGVGLPLTG